MSNAQGSQSVNVQQLNNIADQLNAMGDATCEQIEMMVKHQLQAVEDLIKGITKQISSLSAWQVLLDIPHDLGSLISWVKNFITVNIEPQIKAAITYIQQLIQLIKAVAKIIAAIANLEEKIAACAISAVSRLTNISGIINAALAPALANFAKLQATAKALAPNHITATIKTASAAAFSKSFAKNGTAFLQQVSTLHKAVNVNTFATPNFNI